MKTIWKFEVPLTHKPLLMPEGAIIRRVGVQHDTICMWAELTLPPPHTNHRYELRSFTIYCTGENMPDDPGAYLGTVSMESDRLIFHVFENPHL